MVSLNSGIDVLNNLAIDKEVVNFCFCVRSYLNLLLYLVFCIHIANIPYATLSAIKNKGVIIPVVQSKEIKLRVVYDR